MLKKLFITFSSLTLIFAINACSLQSEVPSDPATQHYTLDNGLQVYLLPRDKAGMELRLVVNSGSLQENEQQLGLAHFVEHMAFKGTEHFPDKSSFKTLEQYGISLGSHINAATSFNSTIYKLSLPNSQDNVLNLGLTVLSDWANGIAFKQDAYDSERPVIVEEWRLRQGVAYRINEKLDNLRYHGSLYAARSPIGSLDIIKQGPIADAKAYYQQWYQPQRMSLVVVGKFDANEVKKQINALFNQRERGVSPQDIPALRDFAKQPQPLIETIFDAEQGQRLVQIMLQRNLSAPLNTQQGITDDTLDQIWLKVLNQRLNLLMENQQITYAQSLEQGTLLDEQRMQYLMIAKPQNNHYQHDLQILFTELQRLATLPITDKEFDSAKTQILAKLLQQATNEARYENGYLADRLTASIEYKMPIMNKKQQFEMTRSIINASSPAKLQQVVAERLASSDLRVAIIGPDSDAKSVNKQQILTLWQTVRASTPEAFPYQKKEVSLDLQAPKPGNIITETSLPEIKSTEWKLSNGVRVIVNPDKSLTDNIHIQLRIPGGTSQDSAQQIGETNWAQQIAEISGYGKYTPIQLQQFSQQNRLQLKPFAELLNHGLQGNVDNDQVEQLFKLLYLKVTEPQFNSQKLAQAQQNTALAYAKQPVERQFLDYIHTQSFNHSERLTTQTKDAWQHFTIPQLQKRYQQLYAAPKDMTLVISGNVDMQEISTLVKQWIASMPSQTNQQSQWVNNHITPINKPLKLAYPYGKSDKAMVSILYSADAIWQLDDQLGLQLLDNIINVRLRTLIREQNSGVYTIIFSEQLIKQPTAYYLARLNFTTDPKRVDEIKQLVNKLMTEVKQHGITSQELAQAKKAWLLNQQEQEESALYWVKALAQTATDDNNFNALTAQQNIVEKFTVSKVNQLAERWIGSNAKEFVLLPKK